MNKRRQDLEQRANTPAPRIEESSPIGTTYPHPELTVGEDSALQLPVRPSPRFADLGEESMTPELIMQYRARIAAGVYDQPSVIQALAESMLQSGDI